jgi:hypothetical protein
MIADELPDDPEIDALLAELDEPPPALPVDALIARAEARATIGPARLRRAAAIILALGLAGAAAYAAPRSPLPGWLEELGTRLGIATGSDAATRPATVDPGSAGVALDATGDVLIRFDGMHAGYARISLTDGTEVIARTTSLSTRFTSEPERLLIEHPGLDTLDIELPRAASRVEIHVEEELVFSKEGAEVVTAAPTLGEGRWLLPLAP